MPNPTATLPALVTLALVLAACGRDAAQTEPAVAAGEPAAETPAPAANAMPERRTAPANARVYFVTPADGATVSSPVTVEFGIEGMTVVRAGEDMPDSGHHHLLVDTDPPDFGMPIPADASHIHFGDASTSTRLELEPGEHTLQLLLGDHRHIPHDPPVLSDRITIMVE
ncbi:MAG: DUF4399 domain-containing protein [Woeseiaceae bacterium]|nr:DUF4399 domain-containing protein [Woeseiaceae bacterium]